MAEQKSIFATSDPLVITPTNQQKAEIVKSEQAVTRQNEGMKKLEGITSFDWKNVPPPMLANLLVQVPFKGSSGEPDYYLQPWQALAFAMRCYELGLSPFSNEVWFNPKNNKTNVTFEGKLKLARKNGLNLSPPVFVRVPESGTVSRTVNSKPYADYAYKCTIIAPHGPCEYTAWHSEWFVSSSPVWKAKPDHMLQLRAAEKCLSFAAGTGASELPDEQDIAGAADRSIQDVISPQVMATAFVDKGDE